MSQRLSTSGAALEGRSYLTAGSASRTTTEGGPVEGSPGPGNLGFWGPGPRHPAKASCPHQICSLFLCLVMDYNDGSFQEIIQKKRETRTIIDSEVRQAL